jgi:hypothetical protein
MRLRFPHIGIILSNIFIVSMASACPASSIQVDAWKEILQERTQVQTVFISAADQSSDKSHGNKSDRDSLIPRSCDATTQGSITYLVRLDFLLAPKLGLLATQPVIIPLDHLRAFSLADYFRYAITPKAP